ncbi:hypothetical protein B9Z55_023884 [Caenorhabditis nigoni]|uniref:Mos1 transposase HTH domain-containing protein n=1 Tax=Caenorhabditis nigoni TaxID=1611254 RepID=A0A2G5SSF3_9PELO|nr:hypothetical protein B9Z55_023884 [Caenorhabditis nigoni]
MLGRNATETTENINRASAESCPNGKTVQRWFTKFTCGDTSLEEKKVVEVILKYGGWGIRDRPSGNFQQRLESLPEQY